MKLIITAVGLSAILQIITCGALPSLRPPAPGNSVELEKDRVVRSNPEDDGLPPSGRRVLSISDTYGHQVKRASTASDSGLTGAMPGDMSPRELMRRAVLGSSNEGQNTADEYRKPQGRRVARHHSWPPKRCPPLCGDVEDVDMATTEAVGSQKRSTISRHAAKAPYYHHPEAYSHSIKQEELNGVAYKPAAANTQSVTSRNQWRHHTWANYMTTQGDGALGRAQRVKQHRRQPFRWHVVSLKQEAEGGYVRFNENNKAENPYSDETAGGDQQKKQQGKINHGYSGYSRRRGGEGLGRR